MSVANPRNLKEWSEYISTLEGVALWNKARVANRVPFVQLLLEEKLSPDDIEQVFVFFAKRFEDLESTPPGGGYFDLLGMLDTGQTKGVTLPVDVVYEEEPDKFDKDTLKLDLESEWEQAEE